MGDQPEASLLAYFDLLQLFKWTGSAGIKDFTFCLQALFFIHDYIILTHQIASPDTNLSLFFRRKVLLVHGKIQTR